MPFWVFTSRMMWKLSPMAPPLRASFRPRRVLMPRSRASLYILARHRAVAVASWTARWAFFRLTPRCLHTLPSLWLFMSG